MLNTRGNNEPTNDKSFLKSNNVKIPLQKMYFENNKKPIPGRGSVACFVHNLSFILYK